MKLLTKRAALEGCVELWNWLAENPGEAKEAWPGWPERKKIYGEMAGSCFACEYRIRNGLICRECLVPALRQDRTNLPCSLYSEWRTAMISLDYGEIAEVEKVEKFAKLIALSAQEALKTLEVEKDDL